MKRILCTIMASAIGMMAFSQTDTSSKDIIDTIKVGNFIIIKKNKDGSQTSDTTNKDKHFTVDINIGGKDTDYDNDSNNNRSKKNKSVSTNYFILDLGFANYRDETDYASAEALNYLRAPVGGPLFTKDDLKLRTGKSSNVNLWLFMQKLNVSNQVLNVKYGLGLEMYNFRYSNNISYNKNPAYIFRDSVSFSKNKLYVGYATVPLMISLTPDPSKRKGFSLSAGVSAGYRIGSRNKQVSDTRGKEKTSGDFALDPWRFAYVGELGLGPVRLYGSYSINALHESGLKQYPYTVGIRFSNW